MKRRRILIKAAILMPLVAGIVVFGIWVAKGGLEKELAPAFSEPQAAWRETHGPLIHTRWKQDGPYAALAPGRADLGCWSVAFAQVLAFHRLEPRGRVRYQTRRGMTIDETLDGSVDWDRMVPAIAPDTPPENSLATARYCFQAAAVVQKDFGSGEYMDVAITPREIAEHYGCTVARIDSNVAETIRSELREGHPLVAYFDDILGIKIVRNGHAAVIDGMAGNKDRMFVHVNLGWGGASDGWYDFEKLTKERKLLYVFRIAP